MSGHPSHSPQSGDPHTFYAELVGDIPQSYPTPPNQHQQAQFPPPPPGPPPSNAKQQYYPPPPPGPPPSQAHLSNIDPNAPPPTYEESGGSAGFTYSDEKIPVLPPRPDPPQVAQPPPATGASIPHTATGTGETSEPSKSGFGRKLYQWGVKAGAPINKLTNMLGSEAFWPTSMDKECDKAARILKSFCKDGFQESGPIKSSSSSISSGGPSSKPKVLVKIPQAAIVNAKGLAIFTTFRTGFHISGAGGSGLVVARLPDGSWSPPAGFLVHTLGAGLMAGLDIYDCVCVLNTEAAVDAFAKPRVSLGGEIAVVAGPIGAGTSIEAAVGKSVKPVWSYMKSRGLYGGVQVDGTVVVQRPDANAEFYGVNKIAVEKILRNEVPDNSRKSNSKGPVLWPEGGRQLMEVLKAAEGKGADSRVMDQLGSQPTPGDLASTPIPSPLPSPTPEQQAQQDKGGKDKARYA
ncbi:DUF500-domain-containing protein [Annulohypoxylon maeteangense]|uniref:DUF500-domain-containing protein n=1 Tax=Annulohypoxylon maeteangense TaxID=1927788 RepID=UPI002007D804|nr:DUF500-domain-containing protein [Annulohypoxylon maeteangense]KAI0879883.1 DUF500-domain-containing protein [Annulohypoxylon maeteangense]